jgi:hypothetical protein
LNFDEQFDGWLHSTPLYQTYSVIFFFDAREQRNHVCVSEYKTVFVIEYYIQELA